MVEQSVEPMDEQRRRAYLRAMGIDLWVPRGGVAEARSEPAPAPAPAPLPAAPVAAATALPVQGAPLLAPAEPAEPAGLAGPVVASASGSSVRAAAEQPVGPVRVRSDVPLEPAPPRPAPPLGRPAPPASRPAAPPPAPDSQPPAWLTEAPPDWGDEPFAAWEPVPDALAAAFAPPEPPHAAALSAAPPTPAEPPPAPALPDLLPVAARPQTMGWDELAAAVAACRACGLWETRTQTVFGVGNREAEPMVIGEAPGADEDREGEPFVGRAGRLLNLMLAAIGLKREQVFIANILKCRPPGNRDPRQEEAAHCQGFLERQIALIRPRAILTVGRISAQTLLGTDTPVGRLRGRWLAYGPHDIPVRVTYHPAYLLRSPDQKARAWEDLTQVALRLAASARGEGAAARPPR